MDVKQIATKIIYQLGQEGNNGYNAGSGEYGDMIAMGILDPTKVTRVALQHAASIAGMMITTEAMVAEAPDERHQVEAFPGLMQSATVSVEISLRSHKSQHRRKIHHS